MRRLITTCATLTVAVFGLAGLANSSEAVEGATPMTGQATVDSAGDTPPAEQPGAKGGASPPAEPKSAGEVQPLAVDPSAMTPEERIKAAKVPPPGKVCETVDESERIAAQKRNERNQTFVGLTAYTITEAIRISGSEWERRPQQMLTDISDSLRNAAGDEELKAQQADQTTRIPGLLSRQACVEFASLNKDVCSRPSWVDGEWVAKDPMLQDLCTAWMDMQINKATSVEECETQGVNPRWLPLCKTTVTKDVKYCEATEVEGVDAATRMRDLFGCKWAVDRFNDGLSGCGKDFKPWPCTTSMFVLGMVEGPGVCDKLVEASTEWDDEQYEPLVEICKAIYAEEPDRCPADQELAGSPTARYFVDGVLTGGEDGVMVQVAGSSNIPAMCHVTMRVVRAGQELIRRSATVNLRAFQADVTHRENLPMKVDPVRDSLELGSMCVPSTNWFKGADAKVQGAH